MLSQLIASAQGLHWSHETGCKLLCALRSMSTGCCSNISQCLHSQYNMQHS